ncbi:MAG TPA: polyphenol oxidase family protein [Solirubrobacteraceae bacterium]|jgi:YfiH family protein|nr:polyphenol oxidase family protein [Solirubrobacteraceae bacterium]
MSVGELACELTGAGRVLFTTRAEGNLSSVSGEGQAHAEAARERLAKRIGLSRMARGRQVHGTLVVRADEHDDLTGPPVEADGQATSVRHVGALVLTADCLPVALGSPHAVAMLHAGWRGLAAGVLEEGVRALRELDASDEIVAVIGPGAGPCCYEVGPEVHSALAGAERQGPIDLRGIARQRLLAAGVTEVRDLGACTICDPRFFSHRREGARAGRQAGVAWLS